MAIKVSEAVENYLVWRVNRGIKPATIKADRWTLGVFTERVGDIQVQNLTARHVDLHFQGQVAKGTKPGNYNNHLAKLKGFFTFCRNRGYMPRTCDPLCETDTRKTVKRDSNRVPVRQFGALLDGAGSPRNRAIVAMALYSLCRSNEIKTLNVGDLNLQTGRVAVTIHKSGGYKDQMPVSSELDAELRTWMTYYTEDVGQVPDPAWPLFPAQHYKHYDRGGFQGQYVAGAGEYHLMPSLRAGKFERIAQRSLHSIDFPTRDTEGKSLNEGMHTFRRSGARALFDRLVDDSYDGAIRLVQSMLHHENMQTTEIYLGLTMERFKRDELLVGKPMYHAGEAGNVITMVREARHG